MFQNIDLNLNAGPIKNAWMRLIRQIQTTVEHMRVTNDTVADMAKGDIVYLTAGDRQAALAIATAAATSRWVGVVAEPIPAGARGIARTDGYAYVRFETGLDMTGNEGMQVFLSTTDAGAASITQPQDNFTKVVGTLADATLYTNDNPYAWVVLRDCCPLSAIEPN